jgi:hypothetical protein
MTCSFTRYIVEDRRNEVGREGKRRSASHRESLALQSSKDLVVATCSQSQWTLCLIRNGAQRVDCAKGQMAEFK